MALSRLKNQDDKKAVPKAINTNISDVESTGSEASENEAEGNTGWADCIAKVLNTSNPKKKKTLVLSRAKKIMPDDTVKAKTADFGFEVEGGGQTDEKPIKEEIDDQATRRRNIPLELRVKPSWKDMERERTLRKVATRGVVQLFNAVRIQQKDIQKQLDAAGPLDSRKDAVLNNINKRKFLDVLMSGNRAKSEAVDNPVKNECLKEEASSNDGSDDDGTAFTTRAKRKSEWNVLREDFMTNKKIKHWDEDDEEDEKGEASEESGDE